ncbi:MAG: putative bifunctional diguanylate cyclase/phosphodiesterase [Gemmobacter sp.]|uniref:putative bifunctional diguanylate cyclase/phosphodiesterase n=1 Tax=Gemmobacter sp. TaxID=1898957 RepID=UPI003919BE7D
MLHAPLALARRLPLLAQAVAPQLLLAGPLLCLAAYWVWGERALVAAVLGVSLLSLAAACLRRLPDRAAGPADPGARRQFLADLDHALARVDGDETGTGCIVLQFDNAATLLDRHGRAVQTEVIRGIGDRLVAHLRPGDRLLRLEGGGFAVALAPTLRLDLARITQLAARLQATVAEPVTAGGARYFVTCSAGVSLGVPAAGQGGAALLDAAQIAADEALRQGPGGLRAFAPDMARKRADRDARRAALELALDTGQICAWFQPQVSADTGEVTGFEALARWNHPSRGLVAPAEFLPHIAEAGLSERLSEVMLSNALVALTRWDKAGFRVPTVGVNFSSDELRNPRLADKLKWELDRFDLSPERLSVEVLETVMATDDHAVIERNITALARLGCRIDLDDFGTGHTSITNIRRFAVHRLKIDRSFVTRVDQDRDQQRMIAAILSMAERLDLDTLAEGVETGPELATLAQLGCGHVQGFGIGRPMPFAATLEWLAAHKAHPRLVWQPDQTGARRGGGAKA